MKKILLYCCCATSLAASAQTDSLRFKGSLSVSKGSTYNYTVVLTQQNGKWSGYSLLDPGGPNETKSSLTAQFSKETEAFVLTEKKLLYSKSSMKDFCYVGGVVKVVPKKNELRGFFAGKDEHNKPCGTGTLRFNLPDAAKPFLTPDGTRDTNMIVPLTKLNTESFKAAGKQVILEIWDGGVEDHDSLTVLLNDRVLMPGFEITATKRSITIDLQKGKNILKVRALNEGNEKPNSARIVLMDSGNKLTLASFLKEQEEAKIEITY